MEKINFQVLLFGVISFLSTIGAGIAVHADDALPQSTPGCYNFQSNAQRVDQALKNSEVHAACKKQVEESYKKCGSVSLTDIHPVPAGSDETEYLKRSEVLKKNKFSFSKQAQLCEDEKELIVNVCLPLQNQLKEARDNNARDRNQALENARQGIPASGTEADVYTKYNEVANQLTAQHDAVAELRYASSKALDDKITCFTTHSIFVGKISSKLETTAASVKTNSSNDMDLVPPARNPAAINGSDQNAVTRTGKKFVTSTATYTAKVTAGRQLAAYAKHQFGPNHLITRGAEKLASTSASVLGLVWGTTMTYFALTHDAGDACAVIHTDPFQADILGCQVGVRLNRE